jgi:hypothetical protein
MASLELDAPAHVQDPGRLARRVSVLQWEDPTPRDSSVARTITPAAGLLLPSRRSKGCRAPIDFEPQFGRLTPARMRCPKRCSIRSRPGRWSGWPHAMRNPQIDGRSYCRPVILRSYFGRLICPAPSPQLVDYPFGFPDHIVGIFCLVTFGVYSLRSEFFLVERQRRFGEL